MSNLTPSSYGNDARGAELEPLKPPAGAAGPPRKGLGALTSEYYAAAKAELSAARRSETETILAAEERARTKGDSGLAAFVSDRQHVALDMHYFSLTYQRMAFFIAAVVLIARLATGQPQCEAPLVALCAALVGSVATHCFVHGAQDNPDRAIVRLCLDILRVVAFLTTLIGLGVQRAKTSAATCSWGVSTLSQTLEAAGGATLVFWVASTVYSYVRHAEVRDAHSAARWFETNSVARAIEVIMRVALVGCGAGTLIALAKEGETSDLGTAYVLAAVQAYLILDVGLSDLVRPPGSEARASPTCLMLDTWLVCWLTILFIWSATAVDGSTHFSSSASKAGAAVGATFIIFIVVWVMAVILLALHWRQALAEAGGSLRRAAFAHSDSEMAAVLRSGGPDATSQPLLAIFGGSPFHATEKKKE